MKTVVMLLAIFPCCSFGQGLYIARNQSATTLQATYNLAQASTSAQGLEIGHSIGGAVDLGFQIGLGRLDSYYNTVFHGLSTTVYLLRPDNIDGGILSLQGTYSRLTSRIENRNYGGTWLDLLHSNSFDIAGIAGSRIQASPILTLLPVVTLGVRTISNELYSESNLFYGLGFSWLIRTGDLTQFVLTPSLSISNDVGTWGLKGGLVLLQ